MAGGAGAGFDVVPSVLAQGSVNLHADAEDVAAYGSAGSAAAGTAGGGCGGGSLAGALARLAATVADRSGAMEGWLSGAAEAVEGNRCIYVENDAAAAASLSRR